eukprot:492995_1
MKMFFFLISLSLLTIASYASSCKCSRLSCICKTTRFWRRRTMESNFKDMNSKPIYIENTIENAINMDKNIIKFYNDEKNLALANGDILVNKLDKYMNNFANDMLYCFESECVPKNHIKNHIKSQLWFGKKK